MWRARRHAGWLDSDVHGVRWENQSGAAELAWAALKGECGGGIRG